MEIGRISKGGNICSFATLAGFGVFCGFVESTLSLVILYFAFGPYSAHAQQDDLAAAGCTPDEGKLVSFGEDVFLRTCIQYRYVCFILAAIGAWMFFSIKDRRSRSIYPCSRFCATSLQYSRALLGHLVLFIQGFREIRGSMCDTVFMMSSVFAVFVGYLVHRAVAVVRF